MTREGYSGTPLSQKLGIKENHAVVVLGAPTGFVLPSLPTGVTVAIITGRQSRALELRAENLGVRHLYQGAQDKVTAFGDLLGTLALMPSAAACMGDDLPDVPLMRRCGLAVSVPDAPTIVQSHAQYVTRKSGGHGAARELCVLLMDAQGTLSSQLGPYLK